MIKAYNRTRWENRPSDASPINERNLNNIEAGIDEIDDRVIVLDNTKLNKADAQTLIKSITYNRADGVFTITSLNGTVATIDTMLEKLAVNFDYDPAAQRLIITLDDGEKKYIDLSALITQFEFLNSETIAFEVDSSGKVAAKVKEGSIEGKHLQPDYLADIMVEAGKAQASSQAAAESEVKAKASEDAAKASETAAAGSAQKAERKAGEAAQSAESAEGSAQAASEKAAEAAQSAENAADSMYRAKASEDAAKASEEAAGASETAAAESSRLAHDDAYSAENSAKMAESYAVGTGGARPGEEQDNAKYYSMEAGRSAEGAHDSAENSAQSAESAAQSASDASSYAQGASASEESARVSMESAESAAQRAEENAAAAEEAAGSIGNSVEEAAQSAEEASSYADAAKSYAVGTDGEVRPDDGEDNAKHYSEVAQKLVEEAQKIIAAASGGALVPAGTVAFSGLPESPKVGWLYNISDDFTTDDRFSEGPGVFYRAGANVYWTADGKWDVMTGVQVTGVKGSSETEYRVGNVNITKADIGLGNVDNTHDNVKNVKTAETWKTARNIQVNLTKSGAAAVDGSANVDLGVTGVLPIVHGGTGAGTSYQARKELKVIPHLLVGKDTLFANETTGHFYKAFTVNLDGTWRDYRLLLEITTNNTPNNPYRPVLISVIIRNNGTSKLSPGVYGDFPKDTKNAGNYNFGMYILSCLYIVQDNSTPTGDVELWFENKNRNYNHLRIAILDVGQRYALDNTFEHVTINPNSQVGVIEINTALPDKYCLMDIYKDNIATQAANGYMSSEDKLKLDYTNIAVCTCDTAANVSEKVLSLVGNTEWELRPGAVVVCKFPANNTAQNPTLNVAGTGAKHIYWNTSVVTTSALTTAGIANKYTMYVYDGTNYVWFGENVDNNSTYSNQSLGNGYGTCATAEATAAKVAALSGYNLVVNGFVAIKFTYAVPANATLNINNRGAKPIFHKGSAVTAGVIGAGDTGLFVYDGTNYHLLAVDGAGTAKFLDGYTHNKRLTASNVVPKNASEYSGMRKDVFSADMNAAEPGQRPSDGHVLTMFWDNSGRWDTQLFLANGTPAANALDKSMAVRWKDNNSFGSWYHYLPMEYTRSYGVTGDVTGSVSVNGKNNVAITTKRRSCVCGHNASSDSSAHWYKVASIVIPAAGGQKSIVFLVKRLNVDQTDFAGILSIGVRKGTGTVLNIDNFWSLVTGISINPANFVIAYNPVTTDCAVELWVNITGTNECFSFTVLTESSNWNNVNTNVWTLHNTTSGAGSTPPSGYTQVASILTPLLQNKITLWDGVHTRDVISILDDGDGEANYGSELLIGASGTTFIGSGESHTNLHNALLAGLGTGEAYSRNGEGMFISSDNYIFFYTNCNTIANRKGMCLDAYGCLRPITNGGGNLGASAFHWNNAYINRVIGTADKLTTARTISLTGDVTGSASFDGSKNIEIKTTAAGGGNVFCKRLNFTPFSGEETVQFGGAYSYMEINYKLKFSNGDSHPSAGMQSTGMIYIDGEEIVLRVIAGTSKYVVSAYANNSSISFGRTYVELASGGISESEDRQIYIQGIFLYKIS